MKFLLFSAMRQAMNPSVFSAVVCCLSMAAIFLATGCDSSPKPGSTPESPSLAPVATAPASQPMGELAAPTDHEFKASYDGSVQRYMVALPKGFDASLPHDLLIAFHGHGSNRRQYMTDPRGSLRAVRDVAGKYNLILVTPDYRAPAGWMGPAAEADTVQLIGELKKLYKVRKVILIGGSMGGASVLTFTALHPDLVDGVSSQNGTANLLEYKVNYVNIQYAIKDAFGGRKDETPEQYKKRNPDEYKKRSAEFHAEKFTMPTAITVGAKDKIVPPQSAVRLAEAIKKHNRNVLLIVNPVGGHETTYKEAENSLEFVVKAATVSEGKEMGSAKDASIDIAMFARVVTSDPSRAGGARAGRLDEFHAEDVFLTTEILPGKDGTYTVPKSKDGRRCIGLEWAEKRVLSELSLRPGDASQAMPKGAVVQYWSSGGRNDSWAGVGQTPWQGQWEKLPGEIKSRNGCWVVSIDKKKVPEFQNGSGVFGIRWVFPDGDKPIKVRGLSAYGVSKWTTGTFRVEGLPELTRPVAIHVYNGLILDSKKAAGRLTEKWNPKAPLDISVQYSVPSGSKADRTLLRFEMPAGGFSVGLEDVLNSDGVFVEDYGVFVTREDSGVTLSDYRKKIAGRETILEKVRKMSDQTFDQAMKSVRRSVQDNGPTMLSLACENHKLVIDRDGTIHSGGLVVSPHFWLGKADLVRMDFGEVGLDTTVRPPGRKGLPLKIADKTYEKGIGLHANAELVIPLGRQYETFEAEIGVYPSGQQGGSVVFLVDVDGKQKFSSGIMRQKDAARTIKIPLAGASKLRLRLTAAGDGISNDAGNWANARLIPVGAKAPVFLSDFLRAHGYAEAAVIRRLADDKWLPIIENRVHGNGLVYSQQTYVAPYDLTQPPMDAIGKAKSVGVSEYVVENPTAKKVSANIRIVFGGDGVGLKMVDKRLLVTKGGSLLGCADLEGWSEQDISINKGTLELSGEMNPKTTWRLTLYIPAWAMKAEEHGMLPGEKSLRDEVEKYWMDLMAPAMQIEVPEPLVEKVYLATQVHCMMAARNKADGALIEPWIASDRYGPLDNEAQPVILGMDLTGHHEFARRGTEMFINSYNEHGMMVKGYTLMGLGQHLWTLGEHYALVRDKQWLKDFAPKLLLASQWIARQTEKTKKLDASGRKMPEYGLVPPGVIGDWNRYAYYIYVNAHFQAGLESVAGILAEINHPEAGRLHEAAEQYRENILNAYRWNQARMPVLPLRDGTWVPATVSSVYTFGLTRDFFGGWSAIGHDVEAGGNHIIPLGQIDPKSRQADWIVDYLEDRWFFIDGLFGTYPAAQAEQDWFSQGFPKLQPHYTRMTDIHALRDDVKPFIRTYFNLFFVLLNMENLTYWEHFNAGGAWNKTHESSWLLEMTRTMLVQERGNDLWLAPFVTNNWLKDGMKVAVKNAPTRFGKVSYEIRSSVARGYLSATITPPDRPGLKNIVIRLRHPDGLKMKSVTVNGKEHKNFDAKKNCVSLVPTKGLIKVRVDY